MVAFDFLGSKILEMTLNSKFQDSPPQKNPLFGDFPAVDFGHGILWSLTHRW